ncbi:MAG TPA: TIGR00341 family protein [Microlunatus sp.]|nr:TIGR00341 family protein [Microlunatus sp.]
MLGRLRSAVIPESQRRTLDELTQDLDLRSGDRSKRSAFWTMLVLSGIIASAGVLADSTATVIGAMIIAPLSTPIMGIALGIVKQRRNGSVRFVLAGGALVIAIGALFSLLLPGTYDLLANSQISGRTSPGVLDAVAAMATGFAGSIALARRDVAAVLPGVAIAISLVPPLAVVGVCLGRGSLSLAVGALLLFLSNLVALVLTGVLVFAVLGYGTVLNPRTAASPRRAYIGLTVLLVAVVVPLVANTLAALAIATWQNRATQDAQSWLEAVPTATVTGVDFNGYAMVINVQTPGGLPDLAPLLARLDRDLPAGITVTVQTTLGQRIDVGTTD